MRTPYWLACALFAAALAGCGQTPTGERCSAPADCPEGTCVNGKCVACEAGAAGCRCRDGGGCDALLVCRQGRCADCTPADACPCADASCGPSMVCDADTRVCRAPKDCTQVGCAERQQCAPAGANTDAACLPACEPGYDWNAEAGRCDPRGDATCAAGAPGSILADCQARNRTCVETGEGAACGQCLPFFVDEGGALPACRAVKTCADLACGNQHRDCAAEAATADAACSGCLEGFVEREGACVEPERCEGPGGVGLGCALQNRACVDAPTGATCGGCLEGFYPDPGGLEPCIAPLTCGDCASLNRICPPEEEGQPRLSCGDCLEGLVPSDPHPLSHCRPRSGCPKTDPPAEGDRICPEGQVCVEGVGTDSTCVTPQCPAGQAFSTAQNKCIACGGVCTGEGETGRFWPFTERTSEKCVCETRPGFFADMSGSMVARRCDADGDGWVRQSALDAALSDDPTIRTNARCEVRWVDRIALQNEYQQTLELLLCKGRPAVVRADTGNCAEARALALAEPERLDDDRQVQADAKSFPVYGKRRPVAAELNPLTKACVTSQADLNFNNVADVDEWQAEEEGDPWRMFAYFVELHRGWFEPRAGGRGRYVVRERSRCEASFPHRYDVEERSPYWRNCARRRDAAFDASSPANPLINLDFAAWSCLGSVGSCPVVAPPAELEEHMTAPPPHGLCEVQLPAGGAWRGMHHHSQFKCVVVDSAAPEDQAAAQRHRYPDQLWDGADQTRLEVFNRCGLRCPDPEADCANDCANGVCSTSWEDLLPEQQAASTRFARIGCEPLRQSQSGDPTIGTGTVGWVAQRFRAGGDYQRGCIDEWAEEPYRALCPGYSRFPKAVTGTGELSEFGRLACGCSERMGGYYCELGCPGDDLLLAPSYKVSPRTGSWMCGRMTTLYPEALEAEVASPGTTQIWELRGGIETVGTAFEDGPSCVTKEGERHCLR